MKCHYIQQNSEGRNVQDLKGNGAISSHFPRCVSATAEMHKDFCIPFP